MSLQSHGLALLALAATLVFGAQAPQTPTISPKFDVVSIKPCVSDAPGPGRAGGSMRLSVTPGYVNWVCVSLSQLVNQAWGGGAYPNNSLLNTIMVPPGQRPDAPKRVRGGPSWVEDEKFQIEVRLSGDTIDLRGPARHDVVLASMLPALRAMLEDRFQLKLRKVTEQQPMYALAVAKGGLKIAPTAPQKCWERDRNVPPEQATPPPGFEGTLSCDYGLHYKFNRGNKLSEFTNINLKDLALHLSSTMDRYVLDKTDVEGRFTFKLDYAPDDSTPGDIQSVARSDEDFAGLRAKAGLPPEPPREPIKGEGSTIFKALEMLGLKLESTKGPAEYLQIDSVQRPRPDSPADAPARAAGAGGAHR